MATTILIQGGIVTDTPTTPAAAERWLNAAINAQQIAPPPTTDPGTRTATPIASGRPHRMALATTGYDLGTFTKCPQCGGTQYRQQYDGERWCYACGYREEHALKIKRRQTRWIDDPTPAYKPGRQRTQTSQNARPKADPTLLAEARAKLKAMTAGK